MESSINFTISDETFSFRNEITYDVVKRILAGGIRIADVRGQSMYVETGNLLKSDSHDGTKELVPIFQALAALDNALTDVRRLHGVPHTGDGKRRPGRPRSEKNKSVDTNADVPSAI